MLTTYESKQFYAGFGSRLAAYSIDQLIRWSIIGFFWFALFIIRVMGFGHGLATPVLFTFSVLDITAYLLGTVYFVLFTYLSGATLGKAIMKIKVVPVGAEKLTLINVIYRETIGRYISGLFCIGYIYIICNAKKQSFHDLLCDTCVVYSFGVDTYVPCPFGETPS